MNLLCTNKRLRYTFIISLISLLLLLQQFACSANHLKGEMESLRFADSKVAFNESFELTQMYPENLTVWYYYGAIAGKNSKYDIMFNSFDKALSILDDQYSEESVYLCFNQDNKKYKILVAMYNNMSFYFEKNVIVDKDNYNRIMNKVSSFLNK